MDLDPTLPFENSYSDFVDQSKQFDDVTKLALTIARNLAIQFEDEGARKSYQTLVQDIETYDKKYSDLLTKHITTITESKDLKQKRQDELKLPEYADVSADCLYLKDIKDSVGMLNKSNVQHIKFFFHRLFLIGKQYKFSEDNYKTAFAACLEGPLLEEFIAMEQKPFSEIAQWYYRIYNRSVTFTHYDKELKNFRRYAKEPIDITMARYSVPASRADSMLPNLQKFFTTDMHKLDVLQRFLCEPAYSDFFKWRNRKLDGGFYTSYEDSLNKAVDIEKYHECYPTSEMSIRQEGQLYGSLGHDANSNVVQLNAAIKGRQKKSSMMPYSRNRPSRPNPKAPNPSIDPIRSTAPRPSFYNNRKQAPNPVPPAATRPLQAPSRDQFMKERFDRVQQGPNPNRRPVNMFGRKRNWSNNTNRFQPNQNAGTFKRNSFRRNNSMRNNNNNRSFSRNLQTPHSFNRLANLHKPVKNNLYCLRCGISKDISRNKGTDHTTSSCPHYRRYNSHNCTYCLTHKNLEAKHFARDCLQAPRNSK